MTGYTVFIWCSLYAVLNVAGAALIKTEIPHHSLNSIAGYAHLLLTARVVSGLVLVVLSALVIFKALSLGRFSYVVPVATGINFSLTVVAGIFFFGDKLNVYSWLGLCFILAGIMTMSLAKTLG